MSRVYLSGPITGLNDTGVDKAFQKSKEIVDGYGDEPVSPRDIKDPCDKPFHCGGSASTAHSWSCWMKACIALMMTCDAIYMMAGWENSHGARLEQFVATSCGLEVY